MTAALAYSRNQENFAAFHALQSDFVRCLAAHPGVIRDWLEIQPRRQPRRVAAQAKSPRVWRTARLSVGRRLELSGLVRCAEENPAETEPLASLLLSTMPVGTYLEIAAAARPSLRAIDPQADDLRARLSGMRNALLAANYGLAQVAARQRQPADSAELLSAASCGLLDAIDRYVPNVKAARFSYFATYWIRYHISRHAQKHGSLVSFPINQHRIGRRIDRYLTDRQTSGLPAPSDAEVCADLKLGGEAFYWNHRKPRVFSFEDYGGHDPRDALDHCLCDPAPGPVAALEEAEIAGQLVSLLRASAPPAIRVMLAYLRNVGSLADAAGDYLAHLHETAMERILPLSRVNPHFTGVSDSPAFEIACDPAFRARRAAGNP